MSTIQKIFIVAVVLFQASIYSFFTNDSYNATENWSIIRHIHMTMPLVVRSNNSLVHILDSRNDEYPIRLESIDFETCLVSLKFRYPYRYPRKATSLENGKIVVWLLNYQLTPYKHLGEWKFVIVEPRACTYQDFEIEDSDSYPIDLIGVLGYHDTFDVFFTSLLHEEPRLTYVYRYNDKGNPVSSHNISVIPDLDSHPFYRPNTIHVHTVNDYDPNEGYFYVQSKPTTHTAVIKRLSSEFESMNRTKLNYSKHRTFNFNSYSTLFGNLTVCRYYDRRDSIHCSLLDNQLSQKMNIVLNYVNRVGPRRRTVVHLMVMNTADGGAILTYGLRTIYWSNTPVYVQRIGKEGWATNSILVGNIFCDIYGIQNIFVGRNKYCIVVTCDEEVHTKCIKIN